MKKRNKVGDLTLLDIEIDCKATVIKVVENGHKDKQTNRTESLEMGPPPIHSHLNYDKGDTFAPCKKHDLFNKQC